MDTDDKFTPEALDFAHKQLIGEGSFMWAVEQKKNGKIIVHEDGGIWEDERFILRYTEVSRDICLKDTELNTWKIFEENKFGDFEVVEGGHILSIQMQRHIVVNEHLDDLEKAIKRAREIK